MAKAKTPKVYAERHEFMLKYHVYCNACGFTYDPQELFDHEGMCKSCFKEYHDGIDAINKRSRL